MLIPTLDASKVKKSAMFRWGDYVELTCLNDPDGEAPLGETLREAWGYETGLGSALIEEETDDEKVDPILGRAEYEDRLSTKIEDLLKHLQLRSLLLKESYPFIVNSEDMVLCRKELTNVHRLYSYFLHSANLAFYTKQEQQSLTTGFERFAYHVLEQIVPKSATVAIFGTASNEKYKDYSGHKYKKLCDLAKEMGTSVDPDIDEDTYPEQDSGDDGLDIVAWYPFHDKATHAPLFLAQAGCTSDEKTMLAKQHDVLPGLWRQTIRNIWPINLMITPLCYRQANGGWEKPRKIVSIFIDRIRIMILLAPRVDEFTKDDFPLYNETI